MLFSCDILKFSCYIKATYQNNTKLCYIDTNSFIINIGTKDFFKDIADDIEKRFD